MKTLIRWYKFNLVGAMGMALQLAALACFNRWMHGHYLLATAAALELTLLHNFAWHWHYTWRGRRPDTSPLKALRRFHLCNGLISMLGNLALMRLLVQQVHLPVLAANMVAIACCSFANFWLGDAWAFADTRQSKLPLRSEAKCRVSNAARTMAFLLLMTGLRLHAQTQPVPAKLQTYSSRLGTDSAYENVFVGPAVSTLGDATKATFIGGVTIGQYFARELGKGIGPSPQFEFGIVGPLPGGHPLDGLVSFDLMFANKVPRHNVYPFLNVGYTRLFATGNAVNFGIGMDFGREKDERLIRIEIRDYYLFTGPQQHVIGLRIGFGKFIAD